MYAPTDQLDMRFAELFDRAEEYAVDETDVRRTLATYRGSEADGS